MIWKKSLYSYLLVSRDSTFKHTQRRYIHPNHPCSCPSHTWANKCLNLCYGVSFSLRLPISPFVRPSVWPVSFGVTQHWLFGNRWLYIYVGLEWYFSDFLWGIVDSELEDCVNCSFVKIKLKKYDLQKNKNICVHWSLPKALSTRCKEHKFTQHIFLLFWNCCDLIL